MPRIQSPKRIPVNSPSIVTSRAREEAGSWTLSYARRLTGIRMKRFVACLGLSMLSHVAAGWAADPSQGAQASPAETIRVPVTRDTWVSSVAGEQNGNLGRSTQLKMKSVQEFTLIDINAAPLRGRVVLGATLHLRSRSDDFLHRITVSTLASDWVEGTSNRYRTQKGSASFLWAAQGQKPWAYPGSDITAVMNGKGHTLWRFADATPPDPDGWQTIAVDPSVVAARIAGISHGFVVFDDVGSQYTRDHNRFTYRVLPNRFVYSREAGQRHAPYLTVSLGNVDHHPPDSVGSITPHTDRLPPGEALVTWKTPADHGPAGTIGFRVRFTTGTPFDWEQAKPVPRHLIPAATLPGQPVTMHLRDLGLKPGTPLTLGIRAVDGAGNSGPVSTVLCRLSNPITKPLLAQSPPPVLPFTDADPNQTTPSLMTTDATGHAHPVRVFIIDPLDKVHPRHGSFIPPRSAAYTQANHLWSAKKKLVRLHAGKNEFVAFQVVLSGLAPGALGTPGIPGEPRVPGAPGAPGAGVATTVTFEPNGGQALQAKLWRPHYVQTKQGYLPDPLLPQSSTTDTPSKDQPIPGQTHDAIFVDIYVPHHAQPGLHHGSLRLTQGGHTLVIGIELHVWDFTLPDYLSFVPQMNCYGLPDPPAELAYYRLAHEHRTCLNRLAYNWRGRVRNGHAPDRRGNKFQWDRYDRRFGPLLDGSAFGDLPRKGVPVDAFYLPLNENWPMDIHRAFNGSYWANEAFTPEYREQLVEASRQFAQHANDKGWGNTFFEFYLNNKIYFKKKDNWRAGSAPWILDEPFHTQDFWALRWYAQAFHEGVTPVRGKAKMAFRADISRPQYQRDLLDGLLDVNVVGGAFYQYRRMVIDSGTRHHQIIYIYGGSNPIDSSNAQPTAWCIDAWSLGADGVLPWQTVGSPQSWRRGETTALFYPTLPGHPGHPEGPVPSLRLKAYRRGQQDVEYLTMLSHITHTPRWDIGQQVRQFLKTKATVRKTPSPNAERVDYAQVDPAALWALRMRVGSLLHAAKPPAKRRWVELRTPPRPLTSIPPLGYVRFRSTD